MNYTLDDISIPGDISTLDDDDIQEVLDSLDVQAVLDSLDREEQHNNSLQQQRNALGSPNADATPRVESGSRIEHPAGRGIMYHVPYPPHPSVQQQPLNFQGQQNPLYPNAFPRVASASNVAPDHPVWPADELYKTALEAAHRGHRGGKKSRRALKGRKSRRALKGRKSRRARKSKK